MPASFSMTEMERKEFQTAYGSIHYWVNQRRSNVPDLVFLPGLTADHRLFKAQLEYFAPHANCLVWDAPSHGESRPFELTWNLDDFARWLHGILKLEGIEQPIFVGQSLGGFLSQVYMDLYPGEALGFIAIDSAPMKRSYYQDWEIRFLHHTRALYSSIPWKLLLPWGSAGCSTTAHGRALMRKMMECYEKSEYVDLAAHGYEAVANAVDANRPYDLDRPTLIICGTKDRAGSSKRYSKTWAAREGLPIEWVKGAGHNSNVDAPDEVNVLIHAFIEIVRPDSDGNGSHSWHRAKQRRPR